MNTDNPLATEALACSRRGDLQAARELYERLCAAEPENAEAWYLRGKTSFDLGQPGEAENCARRALALDPGDFRPHGLLAMSLQQQRRPADAEPSYRASLQCNPGQPVCWFNLGLILQEAGRLAEAEQAYREAVRHKTDYARAYANLAHVLHRQIRTEEAVAHLRSALKYAPGNPEILYSLGVTLFALCRYDEAIGMLKEAIRLRPGWIEAWRELGNVWYAKDPTGDMREVERCYREMLRLRPDSPDVMIDFALVLRTMQRLDEAEAQFRRVLSLQPAHPRGLAGLASLLEFRGTPEKGYEILQPVLALAPENMHVALAYADVARRTKRGIEAAAVLETCLARTEDPGLQVKAHYALGKLYDTGGKYQQAFEHYDSARKLDKQRMQVHFDAAQNRLLFNSIMIEFSKEALAARPRAGNRSRLPLFIVGMPRSGTNLVEQILASHPLVHGAGELGDMETISKELPQRLETDLPFPRCMALASRRTLGEIAQRHLDRLARLGGSATRVTNKMPHNFVTLGLIDQIFPGARVIHVHRDPMDNCLSIYFQRFNSLHPYSYNLGDLGRYYRQYEELMAHWRTTLRLPLLDVSYEELVAEPAGMVRRLLDFCELEWDERCLRFHETRRQVFTISYDQVRQPLYRSSVGRWRHYEPWLGTLKEALAQD